MLAASFHLHSENDCHPSQRAIPATDECSYEKDLKTSGRRYEHRRAHHEHILVQALVLSKAGFVSRA